MCFVHFIKRGHQSCRAEQHGAQDVRLIHMVVDEILRSGILRALRKSSWGAIEPDDLELLTSCVMAYTVYPAIIERATKVARLPAPSSHQPIARRLWRDYDTFVSTRGLLWEAAGEMARRVNGICSSVGFAPFLDLFACHC